MNTAKYTASAKNTTAQFDTIALCRTWISGQHGLDALDIRLWDDSDPADERWTVTDAYNEDRNGRPLELGRIWANA